MKLNIQCVNLGPSRSLSVVGLTWHHNLSANISKPTLAICYENGKMQLMKDENDDCKSLLYQIHLFVQIDGLYLLMELLRQHIEIGVQLI